MFAKVFAQILDSSLAEDYLTRHVFEDLLKLCDANGVVDMTPESIARRTNVPQEIVNRALAELQKPDPRSRTPDDDGRRIRRLDGHRDWGWLIVNYRKYREIRDQDDRREYLRNYIAAYREAGKDKSRLVNSGKPVVNSVSSGKPMKRKRKKEVPPTPLQGELPSLPNSSSGGDNAPLPPEVALWNGTPGLPPVRCMTKLRLRKLQARRKDPFWVGNLAAAIQRIPKTPFLMGGNDRGWKATFDFMLQPDAVLKIVEGTYDKAKSRTPNVPNL